MRVLRDMTSKEVLYSSLLLTYTGGFGYFWAMSTNDLYIIVVFTFLVTQLIGKHLLFNIILDEHWAFRTSNRYFELVLNFLVNLLIANMILPFIRILSSGSLEEFLAGPVVYGLLYCFFYLIYLSLNLRKIEIVGNKVF